MLRKHPCSVLQLYLVWTVPTLLLWPYASICPFSLPNVTNKGKQSTIFYCNKEVQTSLICILCDFWCKHFVNKNHLRSKDVKNWPPSRARAFQWKGYGSTGGSSEPISGTLLGFQAASDMQPSSLYAASPWRLQNEASTLYTSWTQIRNQCTSVFQEYSTSTCSASGSTLNKARKC